ncbi:flagellar hook-length control protein FliK [Synergistales bacterium]|nr:flagellar hook-length control protein FliK [Synergistales bacterium]
MAVVGGLQGGAINPNAGGVIRPPVGDGQGVTRPSQPQTPQIADGSAVEGLVVAKDGEAYQVRVGANNLNARSTVPLFVGQRFRAVWDASTTPPTLKLRQGDMAVLARFSGTDRQIASALILRGLPVKADVIWTLRQALMQSGRDESKLGAMTELWARGAPLTEANVSLLSWYMEMSSDDALKIWKRIRDKLRSRKFGSPKEILAALREGDDEARDFLRAHSLAGKPARGGIDPMTLLASAWWPVEDEDDAPMMAKLSFSSDRDANGGREAWWVSFEMEGSAIGGVLGDVMANHSAMSVNIRMESEQRGDMVRARLSRLQDELEALPLRLQHLGVSVSREERFSAPDRGLDMEA